MLVANPTRTTRGLLTSFGWKRFHVLRLMEGRKEMPCCKGGIRAFARWQGLPQGDPAEQQALDEFDGYAAEFLLQQF